MNFRWWLVISALLLGLGLGLGLLASGRMTDLLMQNIGLLQEMAAALSPFQISTALFILLKNVVALLISFVFSPVLCLMPILTLVLNGSLLSFVAVLAAGEKSLGFVALAILPHGILEIPALVIGEAAALSFGVMTMRSLLSRDKAGWLPNFKQNLRFLVIALILLVPAAFIETFITPLFIR